MQSVTHLVVLATLACAMTSCAAPDPDLTIEQAEMFMEDLLASAELMLDSNDGDAKFCGTFASDLTECEASLAEASRTGYTPVLSGSPELDYEQIWSGSVVVTVRAERPNGSPFASQLELLVEDGAIRAVDPVYWVERTIAGAS